MLNYGRLLGLVGMCAFGLGYRISFRARAYRLDFRKFKRISRAWLNSNLCIIVIVVLIAVGLAARLYLIHSLGGFSAKTLMRTSGAIRAKEPVQVSGVVTFLESWFEAGLLIWALRRFARGRSRLILIPVFSAAAALIFFCGAKRSFAAPLLILPVVWSHYMWRRLTIGKALTLAAVGTGVLAGLLLIRILIPVLALGKEQSFFSDVSMRRGLFVYYINTPEFATFDMIMGAIKYRDNLLDAMGGIWWGIIKYNFLALDYFIPRGLWPDKPEYSDISHLFFHYFVAYGEAGFSVTLFGTSY